MPRTSKVLFLLLATFVTAGVVTACFDVTAQDKKNEDKKDVKKEDKKDVKKEDKKDPMKEDKKDPMKEEKKEEKKEPFKPDPAQQEFKPDEKEKSYWVYDVAFGADSKTVAASYRNHSVKIWDLTKKNALTLKGSELRGLGDFKCIIYANDLVFVGTGKLTKVKEKEKIKEQNKVKDKIKEKDIIKEKDKVKEKETSIREGEIKVWDAKTGKPRKSLLGHLDDIESLAISKDGKFFASASKDNTVKIWDIAAGKDIHTIKGHTDDVTSVSFSPDGKQIVTTSMDKTVRVWDIADAKEIASFRIERMVEVKDPKGKVSKVNEVGRDFTRALFTNDGKKVIAGNREGVIKIYDVEGKKEVQELKAHEGVLALALSPDGSKFATGGYDWTIKIWDTATGKELRTIKAHEGNVLTLSFSPNNLWLASGGIDGVVKIWSVK